VSSIDSDAVLIEATRLAVEAMPVGHVESLADAIRSLAGFSEAVMGSVLSSVAGPAYRQNARRFLEAWAKVPEIPGRTAALALMAAANARAAALDEETVDVVWTGPTSLAIPVRRTREVLLELIHASQSRLTIVSFAAYKVPEVLAALGTAVSRGVEVRLILEAADESRGRLSHDAADAFESLGGDVAFYVWPSDKRGISGDPAGTLHAKAAIADVRAAFVTSANLTGQALTANMELGLLVRGGAVPGRLMAHFDELIANGVLRTVT
jgi:phosphatidylserine/phosphatidylglycerophosphate/cardiolipin synthase-like enzyme